MTRTAVVTDSTCDVPAATLAAQDIAMVPLSVFFGDDEYRDGLDLEPQAFYDLLRRRSEAPTTSQPSPGAFLQVYQRLQAEGYEEVLSLHISSRLSGTVQAAAAAARMLSGLKVTVIDSRTTTWALGMMVLYARQLLSEGLSTGETAERLRALIPLTRIYFSVDSLTGLRRGGRIGRAAAWVGGALGVRPLLKLAGGSGEVDVETMSVSHDAMTRRLVETVLRRAAAVAPAYGVCVLSGDKEDWQRELTAGLRARGFNPPRLLTGVIGSVIGSHLGDSGAGIVLV